MKDQEGEGTKYICSAFILCERKSCTHSKVHDYREDCGVNRCYWVSRYKQEDKVEECRCIEVDIHD